MERLLTVQELSELIQVSRSTIYEWTHIGYIPHYKFPKGIRFRLKEIETWLKHIRRKGRNSYRPKVFDEI